MKRFPFPLLITASLLLALFGCGGDSDDSLSNDNPGSNDLNVVVAFGDSITLGSECPCTPYPARLSAHIGKTVYNCGIGGRAARGDEGRVQSAINKYHPAYILILHGVNDVIHGGDAASIASSVSTMINICKKNNVAAAIATYPIPMRGHRIFAQGTARLNRALREIAATHGVPCVDLEGEFSGRPEFYMPDGLHPNDPGTELIALAFADLF